MSSASVTEAESRKRISGVEEARNGQTLNGRKDTLARVFLECMRSIARLTPGIDANGGTVRNLGLGLYHLFLSAKVVSYIC